MSELELKLVKESIGIYKDFPKEGIFFKDIFSVLRNPTTFRYLMKYFEEKIRSLCPDVDAIVGIDSRGFIFAPSLALTFNTAFVPVRKKGKLPGEVKALSYALEYGLDTIEMQMDSIKPGSKVVIIDDLIATGGTMKASVDLVTKLGGKVCLCLVAIELIELNGKNKIDAPLQSAVQY